MAEVWQGPFTVVLAALLAAPPAVMTTAQARAVRFGATMLAQANPILPVTGPRNWISVHWPPMVAEYGTVTFALTVIVGSMCSGDFRRIGICFQTCLAKSIICKQERNTATPPNEVTAAKSR